LYASAFPGQPVPPGAALRLRSERLKLAALTGPADLASKPEDALATLQILHAVNTHIPENMKLFINEIVLEPDELHLAGQTTSHDAAGLLVKSLNQSPGLEADPPRTKLRPDKTTDIRLVARKKVEPND
jgi:hypothetical protein